MAYVIFWPGHPEFGPHTCYDMEGVRQAVYSESEKVISDMGSDGYDPEPFYEALKANAEEGEDDGELWLEAVQRAITHEAVKLADDVMAVFGIEPPEDDPVITFKMPFGETIAITYEEDY